MTSNKFLKNFENLNILLFQSQRESPLAMENWDYARESFIDQQEIKPLFVAILFHDDSLTAIWLAEDLQFH